ncbi:TPA: M48 family metallopeptidase [Legionella pneumophila]|nr:M48 family metallopeptidase [Legionella pneumophila]
MSETGYSICYGENDIPYQMSFSQRKSLEISVHPDSSVLVKAPFGTDPEDIEIRVKKKARWIKRQIRYFEQFNPRTPDRKYVGGETHLYLGKQYRLKINNDTKNSVKLINGFFLISSRDTDHVMIKKLLDNWYRQKATLYFTKIFDECWGKFKKMNYIKPTLKIIKLQKRWGSLSKSGTLSLNIDLIKAPKECLEYVVIHELCHLLHHDHSSSFYKALDKLLPDWVQRKLRLEMALI